MITSSPPHCSIQENQPPTYLQDFICLFISNSPKSHDVFLVFIIDTKTYKTSLKYTNCVMSCKKKSTPNIIVTLGHLSHDHLIPTLLVLSGFFTLSYKKMVLSTNSEPIQLQKITLKSQVLMLEKHLKQLDIKNAFSYGALNEHVYIQGNHRALYIQNYQIMLVFFINLFIALNKYLTLGL